MGGTDGPYVPPGKKCWPLLHTIVGEYQMSASTGARRVGMDMAHPVRIQTVFSCGTGNTFNLSEGGVFVSTRMHILPRAHAFLYVPIPSKRRYAKFEAISVWDNTGGDLIRELPRGYGFCFINLSLENSRELQRLMEFVRSEDDEWATESVREETTSDTNSEDALKDLICDLNNWPYS